VKQTDVWKTVMNSFEDGENKKYSGRWIVLFVTVLHPWKNGPRFQIWDTFCYSLQQSCSWVDKTSKWNIWNIFPIA
jgi:hypothetical protein